MSSLIGFIRCGMQRCQFLSGADLFTIMLQTTRGLKPLEGGVRMKEAAKPFITVSIASQQSNLAMSQSR